MISNLIFRNTVGRLKVKDIGDGRGNIFFNRYTLIKIPWFSVYLHQFFRSDSDRCLHDHPWPFISIILRGGYWEEMRIGPEHYRDGTGSIQSTFLFRRNPGTVLLRNAEAAHRIVIDPKQKPWSLVIVGRKSRDWGFYGPNGWIKWIQGYANPICETESSTASGEPLS